MNFLDNMDALSAGIGLDRCIDVCRDSACNGSVTNSVGCLSADIVGAALSGFPGSESPPASIFMGDCGSNLIGFLLATLTVTGTLHESTGSRHGHVGRRSA